MKCVCEIRNVNLRGLTKEEIAMVEQFGVKDK